MNYTNLYTTKKPHQHHLHSKQSSPFSWKINHWITPLFRKLKWIFTPTSSPNIPSPIPSTITNTNYETNIITWNASSLNTALPNLQSLINYSLRNTTIINIQETKLTTTKSTKYIHNLFPEYKLIFNNTHALTRCIQQRMPYTPGRGGLLTLIHNKYAFPGNITRFPHQQTSLHTYK